MIATYVFNNHVCLTRYNMHYCDCFSVNIKFSYIFVHNRYNDFKHDPLSACNCTPPYSAENAISARSDLNNASGTYPFSALSHRFHGGTDMKVC